MTEFSLIFSAEIIVPPNLTAVLSENFDGASFRLIRLHNFANFSICISRSFSVFPNTQKSSYVLEDLEVFIKLGASISDPVEEVLAGTDALPKDCIPVGTILRDYAH